MERIRTEIIESYMKEHDLTAGELAVRCGIRLRTMKRILKNDWTVNAGLFARVAITIGVSVDELVGFTQNSRSLEFLPDPA